MDTARHGVKNVGSFLKYVALGLSLLNPWGRLILMVFAIWKVLLHHLPTSLPLDAATIEKVDALIEHSGFVLLPILVGYSYLDAFLIIGYAVWKLVPRTKADAFEQTLRASFDETWIGMRVNATCENLNNKLHDSIENVQIAGLIKLAMLYILFLMNPLLGIPTVFAYAALKFGYLMGKLGFGINIAAEVVGLCILLRLSPYMVGALFVSGVLLQVLWTVHMVPYLQRQSKIKVPNLHRD